MLGLSQVAVQLWREPVRASDRRQALRAVRPERLFEGGDTGRRIRRPCACDEACAVRSAPGRSEREAGDIGSFARQRNPKQGGQPDSLRRATARASTSVMRFSYAAPLARTAATSAG